MKHRADGLAIETEQPVCHVRIDVMHQSAGMHGDIGWFADNVVINFLEINNA